MPSIVKASNGGCPLFIDADAVLEPAAITSVLHVMEAENVDMVASLLRNQGTSFSSSILLPIVNHAILALFPASLSIEVQIPISP